MVGSKKSLSQTDIEEYEISLYGFTLEDFKQENHEFFRKQINKSIHHLAEKFFDMVGEDPEVKAIVTEKATDLEKKILQSCNSNIERIVNVEVEKLLKIPENAILPCDRVHLNPAYSDDVTELEEEIQELTKICDQNTLFLKLLQEEVNSYERVNGMSSDQENEWISLAEALLNDNSYNMDILDDTLKQLKEKQEIDEL